MARNTLRVVAVVLAQVAILAAIPARQLLARARGREITLRTAPVDPFSPFGGYYLTLAYEIERPSAEGKVELGTVRGGLVYLVVEKGDPAWTLVSVSRERPSPAPGRAVLRARWPGGRYGLEIQPWMRAQIESAGRFYLPEAKARKLEKAMAEEWKRVRELPFEEREAAQQTRMLVDLKVDDAGNVALIRLRFGELSFEE
jgi:hypothetical protein